MRAWQSDTCKKLLHERCSCDSFRGLLDHGRSASLQARMDVNDSAHADTTLLTDEHRLMLYALHQQAEKGTCNEPKPWSWNVVESAKWNSWNQLGDMAGVEAMRLYVKFLETEIKVDHLHTASAASPTLILHIVKIPLAGCEEERPRGASRPEGQIALQQLSS